MTPGRMSSPRGLAMVELDVLLFGGRVHSAHGPDGLSSISEKYLRELADSQGQESAPACLTPFSPLLGKSRGVNSVGAE